MRNDTTLHAPHRAAVDRLRREQDFRKRLTGRYTLLPSRYDGKFTIFDQEQWRFLGVFTREDAETEITRLRGPGNGRCPSCGQPIEGGQVESGQCTPCRRICIDGALHDLRVAAADLRARTGAFCSRD